jgi:peptidoglycan/LPS O-acetylase OafA/YrhL
MIHAFAGVRAITAGWVVLDHLQEPLFTMFPGLRFLGPPVWSGYIRVEVFFILSGFVLAYNYAGRVRTRAGYRTFLRARFARLYPVYLVTMVLAMAVNVAVWYLARDTLAGIPFPLDNFVANLLVLGSVPGFMSYNSPAWSLSCEVVLYLVFPLLAWAALRMSPRKALVGAALLVVVCVLAINMTAPPKPDWWPMARHIQWIRAAGEFAVGVLIWVWWRRRERRSPRWDLVAVAAVLGVLVVVYTVEPGTPPTFLALPFIALFVASCASATGVVARCLSTRVMLWGGRLSYGLYLGHFPVFLLLGAVMPWEKVAHAPLAVRVGWMVMTLLWITLTAIALHHLVEEPARRRLRGRPA